MTTAIAIPESAPLTLFSAMEPARRELLKQVVGGLSDAKLELLCEIGIRAGLDPFRKQIYGLDLGGKFTIFTGIDGFRAVARRNGLAGIRKPVFDYIDPEKRIPSTCTVTVLRNGRNGIEEYTATGFMREYIRNSPIWKEKPHLMLAKCVEALAHRMAFTESLGGVYERSEFGDATGTQVRQASRAPQTLAAIMAGDDVEHLGELEPGVALLTKDAP